MIDAQLAPPPVAASRGRGTTPAGGEDAPGQVEPAHPEESFSAALGRRSADRASDDTGARTQDNDAAGPRTGELQQEDAADAGASQGETPLADGVAAAIAGAIAAAAPQAQAADVPVVAVVAATAAGAPAAGPVPAPVPAQPEAVPVAAKPGPAMPAMPVAAPVPPVAEATPAPAPGTATQVTAAATPPAASAAGGATDGAAAAQAATPPAPSGTTAAAPAATVSLTLTPIADGPAVAPQAQPAAQHAAKDAPAPAAAPADQAPAPARTDPAPGVAIGAPPAQHTRLDALSGTVVHGGGTTTPHELAKELGQRVHMAVREGGKELLVNLRPPDLGHLTIRVTMTDGVLQAQITADRPEAAKLLQQTLGSLDTALGDLGYAMGNLDVAHQGGRDAYASSQGSGAAAGRGAAPDAGEAADPAPAAAVATTTGAGDIPGLDLLA